jgi:aryl-alcohol dehydrogenase-like predicted oxidoreductase
MVKSPNRVGLGTFPFASVFSKVSDYGAQSIVRKFLDLGGFYIDTAPIYGFAQAETLLGRILQSIPRDKYYIASKCGYVWGSDRKPQLSGEYQDVISEFEKSLRRLNLECIDLYMSHVPDPDTPFEETMSALADLQAEGKIRDIGVSNVSLEQLQEYNKTGLVKFVQNRFSLLNQSFAPDFIAYCEEQGIGIIPYQVIERGLLTDKVIEGIELREGDLRHQKPEFASEVRQVIGWWVGEHLKPIADDLETSVSALAIWWALQQPAIAFCICGATKVAQIVSNLRAASLEPPSDTLERINATYQTLVDEIESKYSMSVREFMGLT